MLFNPSLISYYPAVSQFLTTEFIPFYFLIAIVVTLVERIFNLVQDELQFNLNTKILLGLVLIKTFEYLYVFIDYSSKKWTFLKNLELFEILVVSALFFIGVMSLINFAYRKTVAYFQERRMRKSAERYITTQNSDKKINPVALRKNAYRWTSTEHFHKEYLLPFFVKIAVCILFMASLMQGEIFALKNVPGLILVLLFLWIPFKNIYNLLKYSGESGWSSEYERET